MYARVVDFFREINPKLALLGVTATPLRHDKVSMGLCYDEDVFQFGIGPAIDDGWLVPVQQQYVEVGDVVFERVPVVRNSMGEADFKSSDLEFQMMQDEALVQVCIPILEQARNSQGLIFSAGVAHAHALASWLNSKRPGCAAAVDGRSCPPGSDRRTQIDRDFRQGAIQFIVNCDTHTEGFDHPPVAMIAMARPTKSLSKYTQQVGRGTRALDGIVDGPSTAEERRAAIAASLKPHVLIMDFVGNSGTHKLVSMVDVLGGNYDDEVRERAASNGKNRAARDPRTLLREAQIELEFHRETERLRKQLKPRVKYDTRNVSPFVDGNGKFVPVNHLPVDNQARGGATDKQIDLLMKFGVPIETASKYSVKQAGVVISNLKASRCTNKQKLILERQGFSTEGVNYEAARGLIDQIANSGWQLRGDTVHS